MITDILISNKKQILLGVTLLLFLGSVAVFVGYPDKNRQNDTAVNSLPSFRSSVTRPENVVSYPSERLDLSRWKLTLPVATDGDSEEPRDILQPELATYQMNPWFFLTSDKKGVAFRAPVNAPTTANSDYPRTELREMTQDGTENAYWPSTNGTHTLFLDQAITAVPENKPDVVAGQIHGDDDDLLVIRLEYPKLYITRSKSDVYTLDENYTLGKRFTVKFVAEDGKIMVYYNNSAAPVYTLEKEVKEAYFKAGVYTQSNCETEEEENLCSANNYGEVVIYQATVTHE